MLGTPSAATFKPKTKHPLQLQAGAEAAEISLAVMMVSDQDCACVSPSQHCYKPWQQAKEIKEEKGAGSELPF